MEAVAILSEEHRLLSRVLKCLEHLLDETTSEDRLDGEAAAKILEYLERFADGCHQDKEEDVLFPRLLGGTPERVRRRVESLLHVHEDERRLLDDLRSRIEGAAYGDAWSRDRFVQCARRYVELQRRHADTEDRWLFPLAEEFLDDGADAELVAGFALTDERYLSIGGPGPDRLVEQLAERFGVADALTTAAG